MKTVKEWLMELPDGYRERALVQCDRKDILCETLQDAVTAFSDWDLTFETDKLWYKVKFAIENSMPLPELPPLKSQMEFLEENIKLKRDILRYKSIISYVEQAIRDKP